MNAFRQHILQKIATVATAVVFLNMSFLLAEVSLLKMEKDSRFAKIISMIISGVCFEEEKEVGSDASEEDAKKKIDVSFHYHAHSGDQYFLLSQLKWVLRQSTLPLGTIETPT